MNIYIIIIVFIFVIILISLYIVRKKKNISINLMIPNFFAFKISGSLNEVDTKEKIEKINKELRYVNIALSLSFLLLGFLAALQIMSFACSHKEEHKLIAKIIHKKSSEPVKGATVYIAGESGDTVTDENGLFSLNVQSNTPKWKNICPTCQNNNIKATLVIRRDSKTDSILIDRPIIDSKTNSKTFELSN